MLQILEGVEIKFGGPWKLSEKSLSVVVPLLRSAPPERSYVLLQEVQDKVDIEDTGDISRAKINNLSGKTVFIRKGTLLKGSTQARGVMVGTVLLPSMTKQVEIQCVHASRGIVRGAKFSVAEKIAPRVVLKSFLRRASQGETWSAINEASSGLSAMASEETRGHISDNLVGNLEKVQKFKEDVEKALEKVPADLVDQVGVAILDMKGVLGVELFDHPDSWRVFSKSVVRNYADVLTEETSEIFEVKMDKAVPALISFLEKLGKADKTVVSEVEESKTYALDGEKVVGECTTLEGKTIHLIGARKEEEDRRRGIRWRDRRIRTPLSPTSLPSLSAEEIERLLEEPRESS